MADHNKLEALGWNRCDSTMTHQLTATTYESDKVYAAPIDAFPDSIRKIPGVSAIYLSGYVKPIEQMPSLSATGEVVLVRQDANKTKTYNYVFALTDDHAVFWIGPFKNFDLHHIPIGDPIPIDQLFGNNPIVKRPS